MQAIRRPAPRSDSAGSGGMGVVQWLILLFCVALLSGGVVSWVDARGDTAATSPGSVAAPTKRNNVPVNSMVRTVNRSSYSEGSKRAAVPFVGNSSLVPDYGQEFWTPVHIRFKTDPLITLCKLNFRKYSSAPHETPMFKDLELLSKCSTGNVREEKLSVLMAQLAADVAAGKTAVIPPTGVVFHEGRVGSTLVANLLGSNPFAMVYAESDPPVDILRNCRGCSRQQQISILRDVVALMGSSPVHKYLFFKMQSISVMQMDIMLEAFPDTPWAFIYRQPVQTMMSQVDPAKGGGGGPCLRSKKQRPVEITSVMSGLKDSEAAMKSNAGWCAGHLNMLCNSALAAYKRFSTFQDGRQRGMLVNYESLPGAVPNALLPMFGVKNVPRIWLERMSIESQSYSKSRAGGKRGTGDHSFGGDSQDKEDRSSGEIRMYARLILEPTFQKLTKFSKQALQNVLPVSYFEDISGPSAGDELIDWSKLAVISSA